MIEALIMGEVLCEIMRAEPGISLYDEGIFRGPFPSGAPAIFIDTLARLGHSTKIISGVGEDDFGRCIIDRLMKDGVDCRHILVNPHVSTGVAFVSYALDGSRKFIFHMGNTPAVEAKSPNIEMLAGLKYFHIMGCSLMANQDFAKEILLTMHKAILCGAKISFDPNIRMELLKDKQIGRILDEVLAHTSVFLPGVDELLQLTSKNTIDDAVECLFNNPVLEIIALKRGAAGSSTYTREKRICSNAYPITSIDPTGAGDCFDAAFIAGLLEEKPLEEICKMAAAAGALNTSAFGPMEGKISHESISELVRQYPCERLG